MWRALFMAIGIFLVILGAQYLVVEKVVFADTSKPSANAENSSGALSSSKNNDFKPGEGLPWVLLSTGAVIIIYTFTIPQRVAAQPHHH